MAEWFERQHACFLFAWGRIRSAIEVMLLLQNFTELRLKLGEQEDREEGGKRWRGGRKKALGSSFSSYLLGRCGAGGRASVGIFHFRSHRRNCETDLSLYHFFSGFFKV